MDKDFSISTSALYANEHINPKAIRNREETIRLIDDNLIFAGKILDIGERNLFTEILEEIYDVRIYNTWGDLDVEFNAPNFKYDIIHSNNVIEHLFNPLYSLLKCHKALTDDGILILGTPIKPTWITFAGCHFFEMDEYRFNKLIERAGFQVVDSVMFWYEFHPWSIRGFFGMFYPRQSVYILKKV